MNKTIPIIVILCLMVVSGSACSRQTDPAATSASHTAEIKIPAEKAKVEADIFKSIPLEDAPLDIAVSADGTKAYVLSRQYIYLFNMPAVELIDRIPVKDNYSQITVSPDGGFLYLTAPETKQVNIMQVSERATIERGQSPVIGNKDAPVHIVAFLDYQCPYCASMYPILQQLLDKYPDKVNLIIKHFPLRMHPFAEKASLACLAAARQNKYRELSDVYFKNYKTLNDDTIISLAQQTGLNIEAFNTDRNDQSLKSILSDDMTTGRKLNIRGVPAVYINGRAIKNRSLDALSQMIEQELKKL